MFDNAVVESEEGWDGRAPDDDLDGELDQLLADTDLAVDDEWVPDWPPTERSPADLDEPLISYGSCAPSGWLALDLDVGTGDAAALDDHTLIEAMVGFDRLASWAAARQARLLAELDRRRPTDKAPHTARWACLGSEYAPDEVGVALHLARGAACARIGLACRLLSTLPDTHAAWEAGRIDTSKARAIDDATWMLSAEHAQAVQARVLPHAGEQTLAQLKAALARAVIAVDPKGAEQRHRHARRDRRVVVTAEADGMASLWAMLTATDAVGAFTWLTRLARGLGGDDPRSMDARRADILAALLNGRLVLNADTADSPGSADTGCAAADGTDPDSRTDTTASGSTDPTDPTDPTGTDAGADTADVNTANVNTTASGSSDAAGTDAGADTADVNTANVNTAESGSSDAVGTDAGAGNTGAANAGSNTGAANTLGIDSTAVGGSAAGNRSGDVTRGAGGNVTDGDAAHGNLREGDVAVGGVIADGSAVGGGAGSGRPIHPVTPGKPLIQIVIPYSTLTGADDQPAELVGHGPIPASLAREIAADGVWRRLVTDPLSGALLDYGRTTYHPPAGLADFVRARDVYCRFPGCRRRAADAELDHVVAWSEGGTTSDQNLGAYCTHDHRVKTHARGWRVQAGPGGTLIWTTPTGHRHTTRPHDYGPEPPGLELAPQPVPEPARTASAVSAPELDSPPF